MNNIAHDLIRNAKNLGADQVDIMLSEVKTLTASTRFVRVEKVIKADVMSADVRVFFGKRSACVSTNNVEDMKNSSFVEKVVSAAKNSPEELMKSRPEFHELCKNFKKIDICDNSVVTHDQLTESAQKCESIALQVRGITNSEGAEAAHAYAKITLIRDDGFYGEYEKTSNALSVITLAEKNGCLERGYAFSEAVYYDDLKDIEVIAKEAADKTIKKLGARKVSSCKVPVVFEKNVSRQLLKSIFDALNGAAIAKGISFLKDKLSKKIFSDSINITDRYAIDRGLRSRPFDADGLECGDNNIMNNGVLNSFLLNVKYANKLGMKSTRNAYGLDAIVPNNVCIENGTESFDALLKNIKSGLYVTEVLGNGLNIVTGNYSQGASGFWIENGEIAYPVNEITIAGNFLNMFANCNVASDLKYETGVDAPTIFVEEMIVGGK